MLDVGVESYGECGGETITQPKRVTVGGGVPFDRTRRITGYLVGTIDRWGNAKKAELKDRTHHTGAAYGELTKE